MMGRMQIGFLHPGKMGSVMAEVATQPGLWCSAGRSPESVERAETAGLTDTGTLDDLVSASDVIISICPPAAAVEVATAVANADFDGIYCDANAISPDRSRSIGELFERYVDGSVVGPPPTEAWTRLYLAGTEAETVASIWHDSNLEPIVIGEKVGAASALKMGYAAWTKASSAMLLAIHAMADAEGVHDDLVAEWERSIPDVIGRTERIRRGTPPKAWRFAGEMREIAATFDAVGLPGDFFAGAAEVYDRLGGFKGVEEAPDLDSLIAAALAQSPADPA